MIAAILAALMMMSSRSELPPDVWRCQNQVEVWCAVDGCAAKAEGETTPLDIWASQRNGRFSVCAYTGCWDGEGDVTQNNGRLVWAAEDVPFTSDGGFSASITLLIIEQDGVGFVRVGGLATPLLCLRAPPGGWG